MKNTFYKAQWLRYHKWYIAGFLLLALSFTVNIFGLGPDAGKFGTFDKYSESIVSKTIECRNVIPSFDGLIRTVDQSKFAKHMYSSGCGAPGFDPYISQYGLQGRLFAQLKPDSMNLNKYIKVVKFTLSFFMALVLIAIVYRINKEFGATVGRVAYVLLLLSPWIAVFAGNIYWVSFTLFLPFAFSFVFYEHFKRRERMPILYAVLAFLFVLKFLNGYEFASTLVLSAFVPVVYYEMRDKKIGLFSLWKKALTIFVLGCFALGLSIFVNVASLVNYTHSWNESFRLVMSRADDRSDINKYKRDVVYRMKRSTPALYSMIDGVYNLDKLNEGKGNILKYSALSNMTYLMLPAVTLPIRLTQPLYMITQSILLFIVVSWLGLRWLGKDRLNKKQQNQLRALKYSYWISLAGAASWFVLMPGHTFIHTHLDAITFYMPFMFFVYIIIGLCVDRLAVSRRAIQSKKVRLA